MVSKVLFLAICLLAVSSEITEEDGVWVLTDSNFEEALSLQSDLLVEFYAPWCGHCKTLAPEYAKAAKSLLKSDPPIRIAKVDATANEALASKYEIQGFPTLKYFINKAPTEYNGGRTEETIVSWVLRKTKPSLTVSDSLTSLATTIDSNKVVVVLFSQAGAEAASTFSDVSKAIETAVFVHFTGADGLEKYGVTEGSVVLFKKFDEGRNDFTGELTVKNLVDFINEKKAASVIEFNQEAIEKIFRDSNPVIFLFSTDYETHESWFQALSKEYKGQLLFCKAEVEGTDNGRLGQFLGLKANVQPTALILDPNNEYAKYKLTGEFSESAVKDFIQGWKNNELKSYLKSQSEPAEPLENGVRVVVATNFDQVVKDDSKDVLVEFYAPWCGHCKSLAPEYERLATDLKDVSTLVIAKVDATENEIVGEEIKGFPTIRLYPAGGKDKIEFNGDRNYDGLLKFLKENAVHAVSLGEGAEKTEQTEAVEEAVPEGKKIDL